jgi:hypothetical protein
MATTKVFLRSEPILKGIFNLTTRQVQLEDNIVDFPASIVE